MNKKLYCIKDYPGHLTVGKCYKVLDESESEYLIKDDSTNLSNNRWCYDKCDNYFVPEKEYRKLKLEKINASSL